MALTGEICKNYKFPQFFGEVKVGKLVAALY